MGKITAWLRDHIVLGGALTFFAFGIILCVAPTHELIEYLRIMQASVAVAVVIAYAPSAFDAVRKKRPNMADQVSMGISLGFLSLMGSGLWFLLWRLSGKPDWMLDSWLAALLIFASIIAGVLHLSAPGAINGVIPKRNFVWLGAAVGLGSLLFLTVMVFEPDLRPLVERLEDWLH